MKKILISTIAVTLLFGLAACNRNRFRNDNPTEVVPAPTQAALVEVSTSTPESAATEIPPTETAVPQPTDTVAPTQGASQSDALANQLDSLLGQINSQLQSVDTIPENP